MLMKRKMNLFCKNELKYKIKLFSQNKIKFNLEPRTWNCCVLITCELFYKLNGYNKSCAACKIK